MQEAGFRTLLQEGAREKIFTEAVGDHWLVSLIFGKHTALGTGQSSLQPGDDGLAAGTCERDGTPRFIGRG